MSHYTHLAISTGRYVLVWADGNWMQRMEYNEYERWLIKRYPPPRAYLNCKPSLIQRALDKIFKR